MAWGRRLRHGWGPYLPAGLPTWQAISYSPIHTWRPQINLIYRVLYPHPATRIPWMGGIPAQLSWKRQPGKQVYGCHME